MHHDEEARAWRYYSFQSYTVSEGMVLHGTLDDIFKDAPVQDKPVPEMSPPKMSSSGRFEDIIKRLRKSGQVPPKPVVSEVQADEKSELARVSVELAGVQAQLAQLVGLVVPNPVNVVSQRSPVQGIVQRRASETQAVAPGQKSPVQSDGSARRTRRPRSHPTNPKPNSAPTGPVQHPQLTKKAAAS